MWERFVIFMLGTPKQRRNRLIVKLHNKGYSLGKIGGIVGLSRERVRQILRGKP